MKEWIKIWWHCLKILLTDIKHAGEHRMAWVKYPNTRRKHYCTCSPEFKEQLEWFEKHYEK